MRKLITGSLMLCSILSLRAQTFVKPAVKVKDTSFAVITDKGTFQACEAELKAYQEILGMEGLPTFIVYNEWNKPEDVKKVIKDEVFKFEEKHITDWSTIKSTLKDTLRDYIFEKTKRDPMILPIIMEI